MVIILSLVCIIVILIGLNYHLLNKRVTANSKTIIEMNNIICNQLYPSAIKASQQRMEMIELIAKEHAKIVGHLNDESAKIVVILMYLVDKDPEFRMWVEMKMNELGVKPQDITEAQKFDIDIEEMLKDIQKSNGNDWTEGDNDGNASR